jgi:hypothetical protein
MTQEQPAGRGTWAPAGLAICLWNVDAEATAGCETSFLVLDGNPLESFEQIRNIRLRVKDGELLAPADTDG